MKLSKTHYEQLLAYAEETEELGWYYGNLKQFKKRHADILLWLKIKIKKDEDEVEIDYAKFSSGSE